MHIVFQEEGEQLGRAFFVAGIGPLVGPLPEERLDHALGLPVGLGSIGPRSLEHDVLLAGKAPKELRTIVGAVIGQNTADGDAEGCEMSDGAIEERHGRCGGLVREDFDVEGVVSTDVVDTERDFRVG